jgi:citrate lyase subunit beta / citryl-CoA lyase
MVPKAESAASLALIAGACGAACAVIPLIETVAGLDAADASAPTRSNSRRGAWPWCWLPGGPTWRRRWTAWRWQRKTTPNWSATRAAAGRSGFGGKLCIHPSQVAAVNAAFSPGATELEWARRVVAASTTSGGGVITIDGRMVDAPVLRQAQRILTQSRAGWFSIGNPKALWSAQAQDSGARVICYLTCLKPRT